jgi:hypothetical protein
MQTSATYIACTETAVRKLFEGIESNVQLLQPIYGTAVSGELDPVKCQAECEAWFKKNPAKRAAAAAAQREFLQQRFAIATLCGAVLQVAAKAIECYSKNRSVPPGLQSIVGKSKCAIPFCIGRELRGVPIGLIIYAGRNQHTHYNDRSLNAVNEAVFERIAIVPGHSDLRDPALDLANPLLDSYASNVTCILGWCSVPTFVHC